MAKKLKTSQELVDNVIEKLKNDIELGDVTVLEELLKFIPKKYLIGSLDEEEWGQYTKNVNKMYEIENTTVYDEENMTISKNK